MKAPSEEPTQNVPQPLFSSPIIKTTVSPNPNAISDLVEALQKPRKIINLYWERIEKGQKCPL
jgi:hypothetical protein